MSAALIWLARQAAWKEVAVPTLCAEEFRDDVVRVARSHEPGVTIEQIVKDFGVDPMRLQKWSLRADIDQIAGTGPGNLSRAACGG